MSFVDEAEKENRGGYLGRGCAAGFMLGQLDPKMRAEVVGVLRDRPDISTTAIRKALLNSLSSYADTFRVPSNYVLRRHRKGECGCDTADE